MMTWLVLATVVATALATYTSALALALLVVSPSALEDRLARRGRANLGRWLSERDESVGMAVALVRTVLRLAVFVLVLVEVVGVGADATLTASGLAIAGGVTATILWTFTSVLAAAISRHATVGLVAGALPVLRPLTVACAPLTGGLAFVDEAVRRLSGANLQEPDEQAEAELLRSIDDTHREGGLDEKSAALLENVVEFSSTDVGEVMTPRTDIDGIELTDDLAEIRSFITKVGHSRIPVFEENLDHVVGVLYVKDLISYLGEDASGFQLRPLLRQPIVVPETKSVRELLGDFQRSEVHMAMVIDEYGGTAGLVTIEDVLEEIVGEIHDEHDADDDEEPALHPIDAMRAEVDGRYHIDDLNEELGLALPEDEEFDTIAGYVLATLGHVPKVGESFVAGAVRFRVLAATPTHVQRVGLERVEAEEGTEALRPR
jgi:putative hemolysin